MCGAEVGNRLQFPAVQMEFPELIRWERKNQSAMRNGGESIGVRKVGARFSEPPFEGNEGMSDKLKFASVVSAIGFDQLKY